MAKGKLICKVCGKEYDFCKSKAIGAFVWQEVACCPEHAMQYFEEIAISRGKKKPVEKSVAKEASKPTTTKKALSIDKAVDKNDRQTEEKDDNK